MSRITFGQINSVVQTNLNNNYSRLSKLQEQISSGKAINRPSDAPIEVTNDLEIRSEINSIGQYRRNSQDGRSYLGVVDSTLLNANNIFQSMRERAVQGANDTNSASERGYIGNEVRQGIYSMLSVANTTYKGDYVFSGQNTDVKPYTLVKGSENINDIDDTGTNVTDTFITAAQLNTPIQLWDRSITDAASASGNAKVSHVIPGTVNINGLEEGVDYEIDYKVGKISFTSQTGIDAADTAINPAGMDIDYEWIRRSEEDLSQDILRTIDKDVVMKINVVADDVFGQTTELDAFEAAIHLLEGLHENDGGQINESIEFIDDTFSRFLAAQSKVGSRYNQIDQTWDRLGSKEIEATRIQSEIEDLDFAKAISDFTLSESVYNASLQSASRVIQPSLVDFI